MPPQAIVQSLMQANWFLIILIIFLESIKAKMNNKYGSATFDNWFNIFAYQPCNPVTEMRKLALFFSLWKNSAQYKKSRSTGFFESHRRKRLPKIEKAESELSITISFSHRAFDDVACSQSEAYWPKCIDGTLHDCTEKLPDKSITFLCSSLLAYLIEQCSMPVKHHSLHNKQRSFNWESGASKPHTFLFIFLAV